MFTSQVTTTLAKFVDINIFQQPITNASPTILKVNKQSNMHAINSVMISNFGLEPMLLQLEKRQGALIAYNEYCAVDSVSGEMQQKINRKLIPI